MKTLNSINASQRQFVRELRDGTMTVESYRERAKGNARQMARWFRNRNFWAQVREAMRYRRRQTSVIGRLSSERADAILAEAVTKGTVFPMELLFACEMWKYHEREDAKLELSRLRALRRRKKKAGKPPGELVHPSFKHREEELLAALRKDRGIGNGR